MAHLLQLGPLVPPAESCGHASTTDRGDAPRSAMFAVKSVGTTPAAVLLQRQPLARVRFALHCHVVATFTFVAGHRDGRSFVTRHIRSPLSGIRFPPAAPADCGERMTDSSNTPRVLPTYFRILVTRPAPTVRPPSRIAKSRPSCIAIGLINSTVITVLSPGITISVPSGNVIDPVTSVVRK